MYNLKYNFQTSLVRKHVYIPLKAYGNVSLTKFQGRLLFSNNGSFKYILMRGSLPSFTWLHSDFGVVSLNVPIYILELPLTINLKWPLILLLQGELSVPYLNLNLLDFSYHWTPTYDGFLWEKHSHISLVKYKYIFSRWRCLYIFYFCSIFT